MLLLFTLRRATTSEEKLEEKNGPQIPFPPFDSRPLIDSIVMRQLKRSPWPTGRGFQGFKKSKRSLLIYDYNNIFKIPTLIHLKLVHKNREKEMLRRYVDIMRTGIVRLL